MKRISALCALLALCVFVAPLSGEAARGSEKSRSSPGLSIAETLYLQIALRFHFGHPRAVPAAGPKSLMSGGGDGWQCVNFEEILRTGCRVGVDPGCYDTQHDVEVSGTCPGATGGGIRNR